LEAFVRFYMEREGIKYDRRGVDQTEARVPPMRSIWTYELGIVSVALYFCNLYSNTLKYLESCGVSKDLDRILLPEVMLVTSIIKCESTTSKGNVKPEKAHAGVDLLADEHESKLWRNWLLSSELTVVPSQSSSEILYVELQSRAVFPSPMGDVQRKAERGHANNAGKAAFVTRILLTSLHEFRDCGTITLKGSGGILCEAMAEVVELLASDFALAGLFKCASTQLT
jgi:hypothetical protein